MSIDVKLAELMMKLVTKVYNRHNGLRVIKAKMLSGENVYKLEWCDYE